MPSRDEFRSEDSEVSASPRPLSDSEVTMLEEPGLDGEAISPEMTLDSRQIVSCGPYDLSADLPFLAPLTQWVGTTSGEMTGGRVLHGVRISSPRA